MCQPRYQGLTSSQSGPWLWCTKLTRAERFPSSEFYYPWALDKRLPLERGRTLGEASSLWLRAIPRKELSFETSTKNTSDSWGRECFSPKMTTWIVCHSIFYSKLGLYLSGVRVWVISPSNQPKPAEVTAKHKINLEFLEEERASECQLLPWDQLHQYGLMWVSEWPFSCTFL